MSSPENNAPRSASEARRAAIKAALERISRSDASPDTETTLERVDLENNRLKLLNERFEQDNRQSKSYSEKAFSLVQAWVVFVMALIAVQFVYGKRNSGLTEREFIAVVVSLTGSVFGFWYLVGRYLFPSPPKKNKRSSSKRGGHEA